MHILELPSTLCRSIRLIVSSVHMSIIGSATEASAFWQSAALQVRGWRVLSEGKLLQCISLLAMQPAPAVLGQWAARGLCPFHQGPAIITKQVRTKELWLCQDAITLSMFFRAHTSSTKWACYPGPEAQKQAAKSTEQQRTPLPRRPRPRP